MTLQFLLLRSQVPRTGIRCSIVYKTLSVTNFQNRWVRTQVSFCLNYYCVSNQCSCPTIPFRHVQCNQGSISLRAWPWLWINKIQILNLGIELVCSPQHPQIEGSHGNCSRILHWLLQCKGTSQAAILQTFVCLWFRGFWVLLVCPCKSFQFHAFLYWSILTLPPSVLCRSQTLGSQKQRAYCRRLPTLEEDGAALWVRSKSWSLTSIGQRHFCLAPQWWAVLLTMSLVCWLLMWLALVKEELCFVPSNRCGTQASPCCWWCWSSDALTQCLSHLLFWLHSLTPAPFACSRAPIL